MLPRWRLLDRVLYLDQIANAKDSLHQAVVTPVSSARADAVKAAWSPWLENQAVPLIWEKVYDDAKPYFDD